MSNQRDDGSMDEIERIARSAWNGQANHQVLEYLDCAVTIESDDCETPIRLTFGRDMGDTWAIHVGTSFMAIRNPEQGVVISRLVEMIAMQRQTIIFGGDGAERRDGPI